MTASNEPASITVDGKKVAHGKFEFRPRDVFIGDRPEGNFIACARDLRGFFQGKMDHFRIYRKVHGDFNALGQRRGLQAPHRAMVAAQRAGHR